MRTATKDIHYFLNYGDLCRVCFIFILLLEIIVDKYNIQKNLFDIICELHKTYNYRQKDKYKLCLVALDELNEEYKKQTGEYYIAPEKALSYYEKLWHI